MGCLGQQLRIRVCSIDEIHPVAGTGQKTAGQPGCTQFFRKAPFQHMQCQLLHRLRAFCQYLLPAGQALIGKYRRHALPGTKRQHAKRPLGDLLLQQEPGLVCRGALRPCQIQQHMYPGQGNRLIHPHHQALPLGGQLPVDPLQRIPRHIIPVFIACSGGSAKRNLGIGLLLAFCLHGGAHNGKQRILGGQLRHLGHDHDLRRGGHLQFQL